MAQPWIKFYLRDWDADSELASCSLAARGLWMHMIRVMHEATPYGYFVGRDGAPIDHKAFTRRIGVSLAEGTRLLKELETAGVFSRDAADRIYSRRMVRDELVRIRNRSNGREGGNPALLGLNGLTIGITPVITGLDNLGLTEADGNSDKARSQKPDTRVQSNLVRFAHSVLAPGSEGGLTGDDPPWLGLLASAFVLCASVELRYLSLDQRVVFGQVFAALCSGFCRDEAKNKARAWKLAPMVARMGSVPRFADLTAGQYMACAWAYRKARGDRFHSPFDAEAAIEYGEAVLR